MSFAMIAALTVSVPGSSALEVEDKETIAIDHPEFYCIRSTTGAYRTPLPTLVDRGRRSFRDEEDAHIAFIDGDVTGLDEDDLEDLRVQRETRTTHRPPQRTTVAVGGMRHTDRVDPIWLDSSVTERVPQRNLRYTAAPRPVHPASLGTAPRAPAARGYVPGARGNPAGR